MGLLNKGQPDKVGSVALAQFLASTFVGITTFLLLHSTYGVRFAVVASWAAACSVIVGWIWLHVGPMDVNNTRNHAASNDPGRELTDVLLITASAGSLFALVMLLAQSGQLNNTESLMNAGVGLLSIIMSWVLVHTLFALKYARLFYTSPVGGINFGDYQPTYKDFAYLAFTVGMTFQVSDTNLDNKFRSSLLRHALLSYIFGTVIIATTINVFAGIMR